jgi:hypothetical protein
MRSIILLAGFLGCGLFAFCQEQNAQSVVNVNINISRTVPAVNYLTNSSTRIDFKGTPLLPFAVSDAKVENKKGLMSIDASFSKMSPAAQLGPEFLTYARNAIRIAQAAGAEKYAADAWVKASQSAAQMERLPDQEAEGPYDYGCPECCPAS